jgi:hypothetical protein
MGWFGVKEWLEAASGLDMDALHVHAGLLCQLLAALVSRKSLRSPVPWLVVLAAIIANEAYDLSIDPWPEAERGSQWGESVKDFLNTMAMPTLLFALARFSPRLLTGPVPKLGRVAEEPEG